MFERAETYLSARNIRPSYQRLAVMDYLMTHRTHPSAEEIVVALAGHSPALSRKTVYNTVAMLARQGAILALDLGDGQTHYDGDTSRHAHFICTRCGAIHDVMHTGMLSVGHAALCTADPIPGATVESVQLTYKGVCAKCNETQNNNYN